MGDLVPLKGPAPPRRRDLQGDAVRAGAFAAIRSAGGYGKKGVGRIVKALKETGLKETGLKATGQKVPDRSGTSRAVAGRMMCPGIPFPA